MPTNLYGLGDNFDLEASHVLPTLLCKFHEANESDEQKVTIWGTGTPRREFLYVDDLADTCLFLMEDYSGDQTVNVGVGEDVSISELAKLIDEVAGYEGELVYDTTKPDGNLRKLLDVSKINAPGWHAKPPLREGGEKAYAWFLDDHLAQTARSQAVT